MSAVRPWQAWCMQRYIGAFLSLAEAQDGCAKISAHYAVRAAARNSVTGERWFRGRDGWRKTAAEEEREPVEVWMPHEVDR